MCTAGPETVLVFLEPKGKDVCGTVQQSTEEEQGGVHVAGVFCVWMRLGGGSSSPEVSCDPGQRCHGETLLGGQCCP